MNPGCDYKMDLSNKPIGNESVATTSSFEKCKLIPQIKNLYYPDEHFGI
jgi:hypothetical protein